MSRQDITELRSLQNIYIEIRSGEFVLTRVDHSAAHMPTLEFIFNRLEAKKLR